MSNYYDGKRVLVTGGNGFLGTHLVGRLRELCARVSVPTRYALDLLDTKSSEYYSYGVHKNKFDVVFHLAADVGGIHYNMLHPYTLVKNNTIMAFNALEIAIRSGARFVGAGSVCAYPENAFVPTAEHNLYEGYPEKSNGAYGNAKRMLLEAQKAMWDQFGYQSVHLVSANLYGPGDHFSPERSHVIPALIVKTQEAIDTGADHITVWGTGTASRDFLYVEDAVDAYLIAGEKIACPPQPINIASNNGLMIASIAQIICEIMGFDGEIVYDTSKPDGQKRRNFKIDLMTHLTGWEPSTTIRDGLSNTIEWYRKGLLN